MPTKAAKVQENLSYLKRPVKILNQIDQILRNKSIPLVQVLWTNPISEKLTWEREEYMMSNFPFLFEESIGSMDVELENFEDKIFVRKGECKTPYQK